MRLVTFALSLGVILVFSCFTGIFLVENCDATGNTIYVNGGGFGDYTRIQDAIDNASNGDTVYVYSGTYNENVIVDKQLTLQGQNKDTTIIGTFDSKGIEIKADYVSFQGFKIMCTENVNYPVYIDSNHVTIQGNIIDSRETSHGIYMIGHNDCTISGNTIRMNQGIGIFLDSCSGSTVEYNDINGYENRGCAIDVNNCFSSIIVSNNHIRDTGDGVSVGRTNGINIIDNNILGQTCINFWSSSSNGIISGNVIHDNSSSYGYEIILSDSSNNNRIYQNTFLDSENEDKRDAYDECDNYWYNPNTFRGNYWSNYRGMDSNRDSIGDTPYDISGGDNQDLYPLGKFNNPPSKPTNPYPSDGSTDVELSIYLKVDVFDSDGDIMIVKFYDASDDSLIGDYSYKVESGETAESERLPLDYDTAFSWYVVVYDNGSYPNIEKGLMTTSNIFSFTTLSEEPQEENTAGEDEQHPNADADGPYSGHVNLTIAFDGSKSYDLNNTIVSYEWDFGDGSTGTGIFATHTYTKSDNYTVTLTVTNNQSLTDSDTTTVTISKSETISDNGNDKTPGFELIFAVISIAIVLFWKRKRY